MKLGIGKCEHRQLVKCHVTSQRRCKKNRKQNTATQPFTRTVDWIFNPYPTICINPQHGSALIFFSFHYTVPPTLVSLAKQPAQHTCEVVCQTGEGLSLNGLT
jgi:hypothetical protein